jgi:eukaryotic-like serine/threonine-protein kinase
MAGFRIGLELAGPSGERYRLTDYLGQGSFGEVYTASGLVSGRIVAVKLLPVNTVQNPDAQIALLNEIKLASQIIHPNVVQVIFVEEGATPVGPYLMMEFISGGTLAGFLRTQKNQNSTIPIPRAREMLTDIAQGTRAINQRLIHRDIKPDNILVDGAQLKISDFGISKVVDEQTRTQTFKGAQHIAYMAPEGWESQTNTYKLDVYSVGLVYYQILTLEHPLLKFVSDPQNWQDWRRTHLFSVCPDIRSQRPEVSSTLAQLLIRMVSKRPQDRPDWDEVLQILSSNDAPPSPQNVVASAVEIALTRQQKLDATSLANQQVKEGEARKNELYQFSCSQLVHILDEVVEQFNRQYQKGQITQVRGRANSHRYNLPTGDSFEFSFFPRRESDIVIKGGNLIGGGYLAVDRNISANLILVRDGGDDLYGRWLACLLSISAGVDTRKVIGTLGLTTGTVQPFGLQFADDFFEHIQWAEQGMHIFNYDIRTDLKQFFIDVLEIALQGPPKTG